MPPEKKAQRGAGEGEIVGEGEEDIVLSPPSPSPLSRSSSSSSSPTSVDQRNRTESDRTSVDEDDSNSQEPNEDIEAGLTQVGAGEEESSGKGREGLKVSEEATAGIFSRLTFSWTSNLVNIAKGFEREVELQKKKQEAEVGEGEPSRARGRGKETNSRKQRSASLPRIRGGKDFKRLRDERKGEPGEEEEEEGEEEEEEITSKQTSRLEESHLLTLPFEETVTESTKVLKKSWKQQVLNSRAPSSSGSASTSCSPPPSPSLFSALYSAFGRYFYLGVILKLLADSATFTSPVLLNHLLEYLALDPVPTPFDYPYVLSLILGISLCQIVFSISTHQWYHHAYRLAIRVRGAVCSLIYEKALKLSNSSRQQKTVGEITNLMSIDASMIGEDLTPDLNYIWSAPIQVLLCIFFLFRLLSWAAFAGLGMLLFLMIPAAIIGRKIKGLQAIAMKFKDERTKRVNETLQAIRIIKVQAWEEPCFERVKTAREEELNLMKKIRYLTGINGMFWTLSPMLVSVTTFATYGLLMGEELEAARVFTALVYFNILRTPLGILPFAISSLLSGRVSLTRIQNFLLTEEVREEKKKREMTSPSVNDLTPSIIPITPTTSVIIEDGEFSWGTPPPPSEIDADLEESVSPPPSPLSSVNPSSSIPATISDINLHINKGELVMIVGAVGSGKSSLLSAILGEITKVKGKVFTRGRKGYCTQQAWIQNATLVDNVLFGQDCDIHFLDQVLNAVCLKQDLCLLPGGMEVEIGEKGINLSGGQKQRVALARCCYANPDIILLDDPLSALDPHVGKLVFEKCFLGLLKDKTRVLVTHALQYLPFASKIIVMETGRIKFCGTYQELTSSSLTELLQYSPPSNHLEKEGAGCASPARERRKEGETTVTTTATNTSLITVEERDVGSVKFTVVKRYLESIGNPTFVALALVLLFSAYRGFQTANDFVLSSWSQTDQEELNQDTSTSSFSYSSSTTSSSSFSSTSGSSLSLSTERALDFSYVFVMLGFSCLSVGFYLLTSVILIWLGTRASKKIHEELLRSILRAPVRFFDVTPIGRILNRFTKDIYNVDSSIPMTSSSLGIQIFTLLSAIVAIAIATPVFIIPLIPLLWIGVYVQQLFRPVARDVKRLDATTKSPVYAFFSETISGIPTIRAFNKERDFKKKNGRLLSTNLNAYYTAMSCNRWLGIRLDLIGVLVVVLASSLSLIFASPDNVGTIGLAISYSLFITTLISWLVRSFIDIETSFIAVERIFDYIGIPSEAPNSIEGSSPPTEWPSQGKIVFKDLKVKYREDLDYALRGVSFTIQPGEKIGIVGRTGAGKSSILQALFRIVEASEGSIEIDGVNISTIGLADLRKSLAIIPQDPVLFQGTVRYNLDPFNEYDDVAIWKTLDTIPPLRELIDTLPLKLDEPVTENGDNFSVGEKQLLCLSRALLKGSKILVLDEATASIDFSTDNLIQNSLRKIKDTTFLCIAHRLNTILDCDKVLVMESGTAAEFGTVKELLGKPHSKFHLMAKRAGIV